MYAWGLVAGWTPLHHAALLAPPTLVSYLMTHGCSPFDVTARNLTPLDIITAHSIMPGREDVALLLEEAMRGEGWTGGRMEQKRRLQDRFSRRKGKQRAIRDEVSRVLGINPRWWASEDADSGSDSDDDEENTGDDIFVSRRHVPTPSLADPETDAACGLRIYAGVQPGRPPANTGRYHNKLPNMLEGSYSREHTVHVGSLCLFNVRSYMA